MSTILITGASTGIGNLTARSLAVAGHAVYASMRGVTTRNAAHAAELIGFGEKNGLSLEVVELDVQSQDSADAAVRSIVAERGQLDVVVHNAGHLVVGYTEAFTAEELEHLFDINVFGIQRVNRAALPPMRARRSGTLLYVGSTTSVVYPPFLSPYVASKTAGDALAATTAYEVGRFGIETTIVMPGPFTEGTQHFPNASRAADTRIAGEYASLDALVARNEEATASLFTPGVAADPQAVADEIVRILALPAGQKPARSVVDFTDAGVEHAEEVLLDAQRDFLTRMGFADLLHADVA